MNQKRFYIKINSWIPKIAELIRKSGVCGIDIETYPIAEYKHDRRGGLDPYLSQIRSIQISTKELSWIIDLHYVTDITPILRILEDESIIVVIHNANFEQQFFMLKYNTIIENVFCTMIASRLVAPMGSGRGGFAGHSLAASIERHCGKTVDKSEQVSDWSGELSESQIEYAQKDSELALELYFVLKQKLSNMSMQRCAKIEFDAVLGFTDLALNGVCFDFSIIESISVEIQKRISNLYNYLADELPAKTGGFFYKEAVKLGSREEVFDAFFKKTGIKLLAQDLETLEDKISTSAGTLLLHRTKYPKLIDALIDFNSLNHTLNTYCTGYDKYLHPVTGKIHPDYQQIGQWQHRPSANKPNCLNLPRPNTFGPGVESPILAPSFKYNLSFRNAFIPQAGNSFVISDFSGNQLRILADFSKDAVLLDEFSRDDADVFTRLVAEGKGIERSQVTKPERQDKKTQVYALSFGAGAIRYRNTVFEQTRIDIGEEKANRDREEFFRTLHGLNKWLKKQPKIAQEKRFTEARSGRKVFFPYDKQIWTESMNFPITTTEVDGAKLGLGRLAREIRKGGWNAKLTMFPYDEFVCDVKKSQAEDFLKLQIKIMEDSMNEFMCHISAKAEGGTGSTWADK